MKFWVPIIKLKAIEFGGARHTPKFTEGQPLHHRPAKKNRTKLITVIVLLVIIPIGLVWMVVRTLNAPAEGSINNSGDTASSRRVQAPGNYDDSYLSFKYPGNFTVLAPEKSASYLDSITLLSDDHPSIFVAMSLVSESLGNDSGLNYRQLHPELYEITKDTSNSKVFSREQGGAEYTGFIAHNGLVLAISLTSVSPTHLADNYDFLANSLAWKQ